MHPGSNVTATEICSALEFVPHVGPFTYNKLGVVPQVVGWYRCSLVLKNPLAVVGGGLFVLLGR